MHRSLAICLALILTTVSIATTGFAAEAGPLSFEITENGRDRLQLSLNRNVSPRRMSGSSFEVRDLAGFDRAALRAPSGTPVAFSLAREAGRLDCSGRTAGKRALGTCRFTGDAAFSSFLVASGMRRPTAEEALDLTMVGARRPLVEALRKSGFEMPTPDTLVGLTALGLSPEYIRDMAAEGYRPRRTADLMALKALDVSPAYLGSLRRVGYDRVPVEDVIQLKALGVTADFIASYQRAGFRDLTVPRLVQLKALGIRPQDLRRQTSGRPVAMGIAPFLASALQP